MPPVMWISFGERRMHDFRKWASRLPPARTLQITSRTRHDQRCPLLYASNGCVSLDGETSPPERSKAKLPVGADALVLCDERDVPIDGLPHDEPVERVFVRSPRKFVESRRRVRVYIHHLETHLPGDIGKGVWYHIREQELAQSVFQGYLPVGCGAYINGIVRVFYCLTGLFAELFRLEHSPKEGVRIE